MNGAALLGSHFLRNALDSDKEESAKQKNMTNNKNISSLVIILSVTCNNKSRARMFLVVGALSALNVGFFIYFFVQAESERLWRRRHTENKIAEMSPESRKAFLRQSQMGFRARSGERPALIISFKHNGPTQKSDINKRPEMNIADISIANIKSKLRKRISRRNLRLLFRAGGNGAYLHKANWLSRSSRRDLSWPNKMSLRLSLTLKWILDHKTINSKPPTCMIRNQKCCGAAKKHFDDHKYSSTRATITCDCSTVCAMFRTFQRSTGLKSTPDPRDQRLTPLINCLSMVLAGN